MSRFKIGDDIIILSTKRYPILVAGMVGKINNISDSWAHPVKVAIPGFSNPESNLGYYYFDYADICLVDERPYSHFTISKVIFNDPATIVMWEDGTKTVVKAGEGEVFDPEKGLALAISKKALGNKGSYYDIFKKWLPEKKEKSLTLSELISEVCKSKGVPVYVEDIEDSMGTPNGFYMKFDEPDDTKHTCMDCKYGELTPGDDPCRQCAPMYGYPMWTAKDDMSSFCRHCVHDLDDPPKDDVCGVCTYDDDEDTYSEFESDYSCHECCHYCKHIGDISDICCKCYYNDKTHVQSCFEIRDDAHECTKCKYQNDSVFSEWCEECFDRYSHPNWEPKGSNN